MKLLKWLDEHFEESILGVLLFVMMMIMGVQVASRYVLGNSLSWSEEITRFCFIWTGFISISYCIKNSSNIKIEQFVDLFKNIADGKIVVLITLITFAIEIVFFGYVFPFAFHYVHSAYLSQATSPACGIPMWMIQSITVFSFGLCEIRLIQNFLKTFAQLKGEKGGVN